MVQTKRYKALSFLLVLFFLVNTVFQPEVVQAQTGTAVDPQTARIYSYFEGFTTAAPEAIGQAMLLSEQVASLQAQPSDTVVQTDFETTRELAWETASQISMAQGSLGGLLRSLEAVGIEGQTAVDVISTTQSIRTNGLDPELQTELVALGLTVDQVHTIEASTNTHLETRQQVATSGFQTRTVTLLESNGLTTTQIDDIADTYGSYGLADSTAQSKIDQLYQTQDELTLARDQALIAYSQLLSQQVFWRQENGVTAVPLASAEIDTLVQDQLRLLTHIGYLNTLWGQDEAPEVGEGQWLFIERYSQQALERTETLVLESQETGLLIDLFILAQIHQVALTAQSGDPIQAKQDLDYLGDLLANMLGNNVPSGANYQTQVPFLWQVALQASTLWGDNNLLIYLDSYDVAQAISQETLAQEKLTQRVAKLTAPAQLPLSAGSIGESDETNNTDFVVFSVSAPPLEPDLLNFLQQFVDGFENLLTEAWNIITGQSDNPLGIGINIVLSFIPIVGELLDLIAIFTEPTVWGKVMAAIGLAASFASDIAELATALGIVFPPALVAAPAAVATELVDIASAILKNIDNLVRPLANLFANMPFNRAFELGGQAVNRLAAMAGDFFRGVDGNIHLPSISDIINYMEGVRESLIRPLIALAERFNGRLDDLFRIGFGDGGFLAGRALNNGVELSDEGIEILAEMGDEVAELSELSDEAVEGLAESADELGEQTTRALFVDCFATVAHQITKARFSKQAQDLDFLCEIGLGAFGKLSDDAQVGIRRLADVPNVNTAKINQMLVTYADDATELANLDDVLKRIGSSATNWDSEAVDGLHKMIVTVGSPAKAKTLLTRIADDDTIYKTFFAARRISTNWSDNALEGLALAIEAHKRSNPRAQHGLYAWQVLADTGGAATGERLFRLVQEGSNATVGNSTKWDGFISQMMSVGESGAATGNLRGNAHVLFYIEDSGGFTRFPEVEATIPNSPLTREYDIRDASGNYYELKNITSMRNEYYDQIITDMRILNDGQLENLRWVFRGSPTNFTATDILTGLRNRITRSVNDPVLRETLLDKLDDGLFSTSNIVFTGGNRPYP